MLTSCLFFPIIMTGHMFEIYTIISEIHDSVYLVLGVKNFVELEGEIRLRDITFKLLNRAVPIFPIHKEMIKTQGEKKK